MIMMIDDDDDINNDSDGCTDSDDIHLVRIVKQLH